MAKVRLWLCYPEYLHQAHINLLKSTTAVMQSPMRNAVSVLAEVILGSALWLKDLGLNTAVQ
jgi:hypothetical protein